MSAFAGWDRPSNGLVAQHGLTEKKEQEQKKVKHAKGHPAGHQAVSFLRRRKSELVKNFTGIPELIKVEMSNGQPTVWGKVVESFHF